MKQKPAYRIAIDVADESILNNSTDACVLWGGSTNGRYGAFNIDGARTSAHRYFHEKYIGPIPKGMMVIHSCDTPLCVNPNHLRVGTQFDNMQDAARRGRLNCTGNLPPTPFREFDEEETRAMLSASADGIGLRRIAELIGCSIPCVSRVLKAGA